MQMDDKNPPKVKKKLVYKWDDSVKNPENKEFVAEVAFNLNKKPNKVTQQEFAERYSIKPDTVSVPKKSIKLRIKKNK